MYRVFQKRVCTSFFCNFLAFKRTRKVVSYITFFNSPACAETKNNKTVMLRIKLEKVLTKMLWEYHIWNGGNWHFNQIDVTFAFTFSRLPKHLKMWFCIVFNSPSCAQSKNIKIYILGLESAKCNLVLFLRKLNVIYP